MIKGGFFMVLYSIKINVFRYYMGKMKDRKRKKKKIIKSKRLRKLPELRKPIAPPSKRHKSKKDYNRKNNEKEINQSLND